MQNRPKKESKLVRCCICNEKFKTITNTHLKKHGLTLREYINKFDLKSEDWMSTKYMENAPKMGKANRELAHEGKHWTQTENGGRKNSELRKKQQRVKGLWSSKSEQEE